MFQTRGVGGDAKGNNPGKTVSSTTPSLFQLCHFPPFITSNRVYPSGFFATISSPPAVLEEPFTAASAESVTLASLALAHSFFPLSHTHKQSEILLSLPLFSQTLCSSPFSLHTTFSPIFTSSFSPLPLHSVMPPFGSPSNVQYLSILRTSCYLSAYPSFSPIYSFNPSCPEDTFLVIHLYSFASTLSLLPSHLSPFPSSLSIPPPLQFPVISTHSFSLLI